MDTCVCSPCAWSGKTYLGWPVCVCGGAIRPLETTLGDGECPARLASPAGGTFASEPGAEREWDEPAKREKRTCGRCGATWFGEAECGRCAIVGPAIGRAFHFVEAVCTVGAPAICGVVEEVHGSRVTGGWLGFEFTCAACGGGDGTAAGSAIAAHIAKRIAEVEAARPARLVKPRERTAA